MDIFRSIVKESVPVIGTGLVLYGIANIYKPAAYIAAGGVLLLLNYIVQMRRGIK